MDARNHSPSSLYNENDDSDDDLFDPRPNNGPPSPFPDADVHLHRLQQKNADSASSSGSYGTLFSSLSTSSSTRPPVAGLKKLALNENDGTKQQSSSSSSSGAIPKKTGNGGGNKYSGSFFPSLLKRPSTFDSRNDNKVYRNNIERKRQPIGATKSSTYFPSISSSDSPTTDDGFRKQKNNVRINDGVGEDDLNLIADLFSFAKPNLPAETASVRSTTPNVPTQGPDSDRQSSGYGSDADDVANKKQHQIPQASANRNQKRLDESVIIISSDDETERGSIDVVAKPTNSIVDQTSEQEEATASQSSLGRKSLKNFGSSKFSSLRNNSLSGAKRKRPISVRAANNEITDGRRSNKRNSNNPATSTHVIDSDSDLELLSNLPNFLGVGDTTLAAIDQIELHESEAFARQLQADEVLARQLQEEFDAELAQAYNSGVHRRRYFGGRSRPTPALVERRETSLTPPPNVYPSSRSPSLSTRVFQPEHESFSRDRLPRRWPRPPVNRRNSDSPTLASILLAASMDDSMPRDSLPRNSIGRRSRHGSRSGMQPVRPGRSNRLFEDARVVGGDRPPMLGHALFVPPRVTPGHGFSYDLIGMSAHHHQARMMHLNDFLEDSAGLDFESLLALADRVGDGRFGLQPNEIERLTTKKLYQETQTTSSATMATASYGASSAGAFQEERDSCSICMCDYVGGHEMRILPCIHNFHKDCVDQWLKANTTCPICRIDVRQ